MNDQPVRSLEDQRNEYKKRRFLAMPLAGTIAWTVVAAVAPQLSPMHAVWLLFICTGSIFYLGVLVSKFTGEDLLGRSRPKNTFDTLFLQTVITALLVFAIAIPFLQADYTSLPLTVGILTGLMWVPLSWAIEHWVGLFHGIGRTLLVLGAWYLFPDDRFLAVPVAVVAIYIVTIVILEKRWRAANAA